MAAARETGWPYPVRASASDIQRRRSPHLEPIEWLTINLACFWSLVFANHFLNVGMSFNICRGSFQSLASSCFATGAIPATSCRSNILCSTLPSMADTQVRNDSNMNCIEVGPPSQATAFWPQAPPPSRLLPRPRQTHFSSHRIFFLCREQCRASAPAPLRPTLPFFSRETCDTSLDPCTPVCFFHWRGGFGSGKRGDAGSTWVRSLMLRLRSGQSLQSGMAAGVL